MKHGEKETQLTSLKERLKGRSEVHVSHDDPSELPQAGFQAPGTFSYPVPCHSQTQSSDKAAAMDKTTLLGPVGCQAPQSAAPAVSLLPPAPLHLPTHSNISCTEWRKGYLGSCRLLSATHRSSCLTTAYAPGVGLHSPSLGGALG